MNLSVLRTLLYETLSHDDLNLVGKIVGAPRLETPNLEISPDGKPYLYRWHIVYDMAATVHLHIQVASDPGRELHDHPWDNQSVILSNGYEEEYWPMPSDWHARTRAPHHKRSLRKGDVVTRKAEEAHRLILPPEFAYTMTLFSAGPVRRNDWGFWYPDGWHSHKQHCIVDDAGVSLHVDREAA